MIRLRESGGEEFVSGKINDSFKKSYCNGEQSNERLKKNVLKGHAVKQRLLFRKYGK